MPPNSGTTPGRGFRAALACAAALLLACFATLPWTLGGVRIAGSTGEVPRYNAGTTTQARTPPGGSFTLGSDALGRSVLVRLLLGGAISLSVGVLAAGVSVSIGTLYGATAGWVGGRVDAIMMRIVDVLYGLPTVLLVVLLSVAADAFVGEYVSRHKERTEWVRAQGPAEGERGLLEARALERFPPRELSAGQRTALDLATLFVAIGGASWLTMARVVRGQVLSLKARPFMEAARGLGLRPARVFLRHLLPNLGATILAYATLTVPQAILQESFLSFLGIGVKPPLPSWGTLAAEGIGELNPYQSHWWLLLFPCLALSVTLLLLNIVGERLRRSLDPKAGARS